MKPIIHSLTNKAMKTITQKYLESHNACQPGMRWVTENKLIGLSAIDFLNKLIEAEKLDWANWLIVRVMNKKQKVQYAVFAAEQVLHIFENKYPNDDRPRKAIEAAKNYLENPSVRTKNCLLYTSPSPRDRTRSRMPSSA